MMELLFMNRENFQHEIFATALHIYGGKSIAEYCCRPFRSKNEKNGEKNNMKVSLCKKLQPKQRYFPSRSFSAGVFIADRGVGDTSNDGSLWALSLQWRKRTNFDWATRLLLWRVRYHYLVTLTTMRVHCDFLQVIYSRSGELRRSVLAKGKESDKKNSNKRRLRPQRSKYFSLTTSCYTVCWASVENSEKEIKSPERIEAISKLIDNLLYVSIKAFTIIRPNHVMECVFRNQRFAVTDRMILGDDFNPTEGNGLNSFVVS